MSIASYYADRAKLFAEFEQEATLMLAQGISAEAIAELHRADYETWKKNRNYNLHKQTPLDDYAENSEDDTRNVLDEPRYAQHDDQESAFVLAEQIENPKLYRVLKSLKPNELELLEADVNGGLTQGEYAGMKGVTQQTVQAKLKRLLARLREAVE